MSSLPVKNEDTEHGTKDSDFTNTVADLDIVDSISGEYGNFIHQTDSEYTYGDESLFDYNGL
jgi:hypothetical protein